MATALLIIDMINALDFPQGKALFKNALPAAENIHKLKKKFQKKKQPVIYVNDNFGRWKSDWNEMYSYCTQEKCLGAPIAKLLVPDRSDFFVLKPRHSGFFSTNLEVLLKELKVNKLVITGVAANMCVLFTVNDAYMRGYDIHVPKNCIASESKKDTQYVLDLFSRFFKVKTAVQ